MRHQSLDSLAPCSLRMVVDVLRRTELRANQLEFGNRGIREYPTERFHFGNQEPLELV